MKEFVIIGDACCELPKELREQYLLKHIPMNVAYDDTSLLVDSDWESISAKDFYDLMRNGKRVFTSQVTAGDYEKHFEGYLKQGFDILSISCSSALSGSYNASCVAKDELLKKYPHCKIVCVDSLTASFGQTILCILASKLRAKGLNMEQIAQELNKTRFTVNQVGSVNELKFLKMAGRISTGTAVFGTLLSVKPIVVSNKKGENVSAEKTIGRTKSIRRLAQLTCEKYTGEQVEEIFIAHADCLEDAEKLKSLILEKLPKVKVFLGILNPLVGASCGPSMISAYFVGQEKPEN